MRLAPLPLLLALFACPPGAWALSGTEACRGGGAFAKQEDASYRFEWDCQAEQPLERRRYFQKTGTIAQVIYFQNGVARELRAYSSGGEWTTLHRFAFTSAGTVIRSAFKVVDGAEGPEQSREELQDFDPESTDVQIRAFALRKWAFREPPETGVDFVAHYHPGDSQRIQRKDYLNERGELLTYIDFHYAKDKEKPVGFSEFQANGKRISQLELYEPFTPRKSLERLGLSEAEIGRRISHQQRSDRFLIAVIDSGFDYNHSELSWKWWNNPLDPVDGRDNDGNGWIDDSFGWDQQSNSHLPTESSTSLSSMTRPDSHGTHVAHIFTRDLEDVGLVGFGGDYTRAEYIDQVSAFLKKHKVKIVNISIGLPKDFKDDLGLRQGIKAHERMMRDNPETLFVVAAGNEMKDLDLSKNQQYPASFDLPNVLKVGSLHTNRILPGQRAEYVMSPWSNTGKKSVDILAPGLDISAARIGGGSVVHSGTSMASPYMAREAARLWMLFPSLTALQIKEAFLRSAYPMVPAPAIRSAGFVDFDAAVKAAKELNR